MKESTGENLPGITFDQILSFKDHAKILCRKACHKLQALARVSCYMDTEKLQHLMRAFVLSHFSYCPLVWMFYDRTTNHRINHVHERALCIAYKVHRNDFGYLLEQSNLMPIHVRNLQLLMMKIFKTKPHLNPPVMMDIFQERNVNYNQRHGNDAQLPKVRTTAFGIETITYLGSRLWQLLPQEIKQSNTLSIFTKELNVGKVVSVRSLISLLLLFLRLDYSYPGGLNHSV